MRAAYGTAAATRACAFTIRLAAISSIARVIFFVDCTDRMRRRRMRSWPPAMLRLLLRLEGLGRRLRTGGDRVARRDVCLGAGHRGGLEPADELLDRDLQRVALGQRALVANRRHEIGLARAHVVEELGLESLDVGSGN